MSFTFVELVMALRQIRKVNFQSGYSNIVDVPVAVRNASRDARTWEITTSDGRTFIWNEQNLNPVLSFADSPVRAVSHFSFFDLMAAIRGMRTMKFTTGEVVTLAIPQSVTNHSRNASVFSIDTTNGSFSWTDDNSGPTVISEV